MSNRFVWDGLEELKEALRNLPSDLTGEASHLVQGAANGAAATIGRAYGEHRHSGDLVDHLTAEEQSVGEFGTAVIVKNTSKHAWLFENGTQARHYMTVKGVQHPTGKMPPAHVFVPAVMRKRRQMYTELRAMLTRHGLEVSGDAD